MIMDKIIEYLKNNWQRTAIIAGAVLIVLSAGSVAVLSMARSRQFNHQPAVSNSNNNAPVSVSAATVRTYADLYAVSIDNHVDARPVSGINQAVIVYETPVEGDITRFLAFFERGTTVAQIGPVRSARLYLLDWVTQLGAAAFFHFGGSPEAMAQLATNVSLGAINNDGAGAAGNLFWRDAGRQAPHNAYTSSGNADKFFAARVGSANVTSGWLMAPDPDLSARGADGQKVAAPLSSTAAYSPVWIYDQMQNVYRRTVKGQVEKDAAGAAITAKNIIAISTDVSVIDNDGRLKIATSGKGAARIYRNGTQQDVTWEKSDAGATPVRFYAADGSEAVLTAGSVWLEVVRK